MHVRQPVLIFSAMMLAVVPVTSAQKAYPRPPGANTTAAAPQDSTTAASPAEAPAQGSQAANTAASASTDASSQPSAPTPDATGDTPPPAKVLPGKAAKDTAAKDKKAKEKKGVYTGPNEIVTLPPTEMLDENGKPQLDPDGKPLFNAPQKQQRDKKGHPLFDENGKPVFQTATDLGYDDHGKKIHAAKVKPPKLVPVHVSRGTFTVDGVTGKAALNYDIPDLKYMYFYVPGTGIVIVSNTTFPGAKEYKGAFNDKLLDVTVGDHKLELASDTTLLSKKPESAFVKIDRDYNLPSRFPVVGYGKLRVQPYAWPGAKPNAALADTVAPPPLPKNLQPTLAVQPCPKGQVRAVATPARPGEPAPPIPPCMAPATVKAVGGLNSTGPKAATTTDAPAAAQ